MILKTHELWCINTRQTAKMKGPEPSSVQGVVQHSKGVAGVVRLAASDDPQVAQRHETHRHMGDKHIALHLHDPLGRHASKGMQLSPSYQRTRSAFNSLLLTSPALCKPL